MTEKVANFINLLYSFRSYIVWLLIFGVAIIFRRVNYMDGAQFVDLIKNTFLALSAVHGTEHISTTIKTYFDSTGKVKKVDAEPDEGDDLIEEKNDASKT